MDKILDIRGLCKRYPAFALKDVSFSVEKGQIMGFVGRNGAGKTTTLKAMLNLVHPDAGTVKVFGLEFGGHEDEIKRRIGYAVGGMSYYPRRTVGEILAVTRRFYDSWDEAACRHYLEVFRLDEGKRLRELSEGMKVKFALTMALSHRAELLILDEPTSGLDPVSRDELCDIFRQLAAKGVSILFSTHITSDLEKCADAITYIKGGELVASEGREAFIERFAAEIGHRPSFEEIMVHLEKEALTL